MIMYIVHYPSGLVGLYPGSTFESALSGTTKLYSTFESTVELKFDTTDSATFELGLIHTGNLFWGGRIAC